jgi:hypothetical protein
MALNRTTVPVRRIAKSTVFAALAMLLAGSLPVHAQPHEPGSSAPAVQPEHATLGGQVRELSAAAGGWRSHRAGRHGGWRRMRDSRGALFVMPDDTGVERALPGQQSPIAPRGIRPSSIGRKVAFGLLGAAGGFFLGGYVGATIEGNRCACDDPGLQGFLIGAPIGTAVGAILGVTLAGR